MTNYCNSEIHRLVYDRVSDESKSEDFESLFTNNDSENEQVQEDHSQPRNTI